MVILIRVVMKRKLCCISIVFSYIHCIRFRMHCMVYSRILGYCYSMMSTRYLCVFYVNLCMHCIMLLIYSLWEFEQNEKEKGGSGADCPSPFISSKLRSLFIYSIHVGNVYMYSISYFFISIYVHLWKSHGKPVLRTKQSPRRLVDC